MHFITTCPAHRRAKKPKQLDQQLIAKTTAVVSCGIEYRYLHMKISDIWVGVLLSTITLSPASAGEHTRADTHAPIGVMAEHIHHKGKWMLSYRFMSMSMDGNVSGSDPIDPDTIVSTEANRFFGMPGQPPTLRVVPTDMTMNMHMLGAMYAPSDRVTLMLMLNYYQKTMNLFPAAGHSDPV